MYISSKVLIFPRFFFHSASPPYKFPIINAIAAAMAAAFFGRV